MDFTQQEKNRFYDLTRCGKTFPLNRIVEALTVSDENNNDDDE